MPKQADQIPIHNIKTREMHSPGFDIIDLARNKEKEYDSSSPHRHNFFELFFFINGTGHHEIDFHKFPIENNTVHFVSPGQIHKLNVKKSKGYVLCFSEDFVFLNGKEDFSEKFPFYDVNRGLPVIKLTKAPGDEILTLIECIIREFKLGAGSQAEVLRSYLNIILIRLKNFYTLKQKAGKAAGRDKKEKLALFKKLINSNYIHHKTMSYYASQLNISPNHLNALCKKHEGKTAIKLVQERLLLEAKRLLYATDMNIKEISFHLNIDDVAYFTRFFKKHMALSPVQYRLEFSKNR